MRDDIKNKVKKRDLLDCYPKYKQMFGSYVEVLDVRETLRGIPAYDNARLGPFYDVVNVYGTRFGGISHKHFSRRHASQRGSITEKHKPPTSTADEPFVPRTGTSPTQQGYGWA